MNQAELIVQIALNEVGYLEKKTNANLDSKTANAGYNNYTKYGKWFGENVIKSSVYINAAWCDMFKTWCANQAGVTEDQLPFTAYCQSGVNWFKNKGLFHDPSGYTPKTGDIIYYKTSTTNDHACHVGIVNYVSGGYVHTIEGNTSTTAGVVANGGGVATKKYSLSYNRILGYGSPLYEEIMTETEVKNLISTLAPSLIKKEINSYFDSLKECSTPSEWVIKEGFMAPAIKSGLTDGSSPLMYMTREQFITIIMRYYDLITSQDMKSEEK